MLEELEAGDYVNDFDLVTDLKKKNLEYETKMLVNTTVKSIYEMDIKGKAKLVISSEMGSGTMIEEVKWYA